jgi:hypothetical protein
MPPMRQGRYKTSFELQMMCKNDFPPPFFKNLQEKLQAYSIKNSFRFITQSLLCDFQFF